MAIYFEIADEAEVTMLDLNKYESSVKQLSTVLKGSPSDFNIEFEIEEEGFDSAKEVAFMSLISTPLGSHTVGAIITFVGRVKAVERNRYRLVPTEMFIDQKIVVKSSDVIDKDELIKAFELVEHRYNSAGYEVVRMLK